MDEIFKIDFKIGLISSIDLKEPTMLGNVVLIFVVLNGGLVGASPCFLVEIRAGIIKFARFTLVTLLRGIARMGMSAYFAADLITADSQTNRISITVKPVEY